MGLKLETSPASEPLTLAEVKAFLRLGGLGAGARISATIGTNSYVTGFSVLAGGAGYPANTTATLTGGSTGTTATTTLTISGGSITAAAVNASGSGYSSAPVVLLSGGDWAYEDTKLDNLIKAARQRAEIETQRQLVSAGWKFTGQPDADGRMTLPKTPVTAVNTVNYYDTAGVVQTASSTTYTAYLDQEPASLVFTTLPSFDATRDDAVQVHFTSGMGTSDIEGLKLGMLWCVEDAYRGTDDNDAAISRQFELFRVWRSAS